MTAAFARRPAGSWFLFSWVIVCVAALGTAFYSISWPYVDVHNNLREASSWSWSQYTRYAFTRGVEYRPLLTLALKGAYEIVGLRLWIYQTLVLLQFVAVLALLLWLFRPVGTRRSLAALIALSCIVGLHTTGILFGFVPLNAYSGALLLILTAIALAIHPRTRDADWVFLPLTAAALFLIEAGILIVPVVIALWWLEAPGLSRRGVVAMASGLVLYLVTRARFGAPAELGIYTGSGLGFSQLAPEDLRNIFEHAPWLFWLYNLVASFLSVLFSEPRAGEYQFVESLMRGGAPLWQWLHVVSSVATTGLIAWTLVSRPPAATRDRWLLAAGAMLLAGGSALGMLYTRDRIGLYAGVGYGLILYVAAGAWLDSLPAAPLKRRIAIGVTAVLAVLWTFRTVELYFQLRDRAWDYHLEWTDRYADLGGPDQPQTPLLASLREAALRSAPPDPRLDPAWTYAIFERRFSPESGTPRASGDAAADAAVRALSLPFDVRWKTGLDDTARQQLEGELGLTNGELVARDPRGRTWEYQLRAPTRERIRAVVLHEAVEDTGRVDTERFEIQQ